jgi:hypothetical protein
MCGRYRLTAKERYLRDHFGLDVGVKWLPRWNIAPTQMIPTIRQHAKEPVRIFSLMRWGLIPYWAKDSSMGWRVIDKRRDLSAAGRYSKADGRQGDRRKIARAAEDVIRIRVISEPLISEEDFQTVQRIMDLKQAKHWRTQSNVEHRFTYNGFLTCASCGQVVHTAHLREGTTMPAGEGDLPIRASRNTCVGRSWSNV